MENSAFVELTIVPAKPGKPTKTLFLKTDIKRIGPNKKCCIVVTGDRVAFQIEETFEYVKKALNA